MTARRLSLTVVAVVVLAAASAIPLAASSSSSEVPITTASAQARQLYLQAVDKSDNLERAAAAELATQAIAADPEFARAYVLRAALVDSPVERASDLEKAVKQLEKVSTGERHMILAAKADFDGDGAGVKSNLEKLVALFPQDKHVQQQMGFYYSFVQDNPKLAANHYRKATTIDPSFGAAYNMLGYAEMAAGNSTAAETAFRRYISVAPERPNPYDSYAEMLMKSGRYDESIAQYKKALEKDPRFPSALAGIGTNLMFKKDYDGARQAYEEQRAKAYGLAGELDAMENIATSYVDEGKSGEAVRVLDDVAKRALEGDLPARAVNAQLDAAFVLTQAGNPDLAGRHVQQARTVAKSDGVPGPVRARLETAADIANARVLASQGQYSEANAQLAKAAAAATDRKNPNEMRRMNEAMGFMALKQKRYRDALAYLQNADSRSPYVLYERALAAEGLGQSQRAATLLETVANWNASDLGYAVVRSEAQEKSAAVAVATRGRKK